MTSAIFKVQRPLNGDGPWLIYTRSRDRLFLVEPADIPDAVHDAMGDDLKGYFAGSVRAKTLTLDRRLAEQPW